MSRVPRRVRTMHDPLFDRDLDDFPPILAGDRSRSVPPKSDDRANPRKGPSSPRGPRRGAVAGWFDGLGTPALFAWSALVGTLLTLPVVLAIRPETRHPLPFYLVSVVVAVVGTIKSRRWLDRGGVDAVDEPDLDAWDFAVLTGEDLFRFTVGVLFSRRLVYCPPQSNAILPRGPYTGDDDREQAVYQCFPWAGWKSRNPHPDPAPRLRTDRQEILRRLEELGLANTSERIAKYQRLLFFLWTLPLILSVWGMFSLQAEAPRDRLARPYDLAGLMIMLSIIHFVVWCIRASRNNPQMEAERGRFPTRGGRRVLKRARSVHGGLRPGVFSALAPSDAALSLGLFGLDSWSQADPSISTLRRRLIAPPSSDGGGGGGN
jgi:uncharacterized protein (TIGR04222 family)